MRRSWSLGRSAGLQTPERTPSLAHTPTVLGGPSVGQWPSRNDLVGRLRVVVCVSVRLGDCGHGSAWENSLRPLWALAPFLGSCFSSFASSITSRTIYRSLFTGISRVHSFTRIFFTVALYHQHSLYQTIPNVSTTTPLFLCLRKEVPVHTTPSLERDPSCARSQDQKCIYTYI